LLNSPIAAMNRFVKPFGFDDARALLAGAHKWPGPVYGTHGLRTPDERNSEDGFAARRSP
jgi:hypothetical protein